MDASKLIQGSDEWKLARCGSLGASRVSDAIAKTKTGWGASRSGLMSELIVERLTGVPYNGYQNEAMIRGQQVEPQARSAYAATIFDDVTEVGIIRHPSIQWSHASPDGLVGDDGIVEIKCPQSNTHIETLLGKSIPGNYITQIQWQLCCTGRKWCDWVSFDDRLPAPMRLFVKRVHRDDAAIATLNAEVTTFLAELDSKIAALTKLYKQEAA